MKTIVLAGNHQEFERYLNDNGLTTRDAIYGDHNHMAGVEAAKVVVYGTFWDRKDATELERFAKTRIRPEQPELFDIEKGRELRDAGIEKVTGSDPDWQLHARSVIRELAASGEPFSTDDFHDRLDFQPHHHNAVGGVFRWAMREGLIEKQGTLESKRPSAHARLIWMYVGKNK